MLEQTEIWKDIPEFQGFYQISNLGRVRSCDRYVAKHKNGALSLLKGSLKKIVYEKNHYPFVDLYKNNKRSKQYMHRLMAIAFLPNPKNLKEINHIDGNKQNFSPSNLEWCSHIDNCLHAINTKLHDCQGEQHHNATLLNETVIKIRELHQSGITQTEISKKFSINLRLVSKIVNRERWKHIA
jgi:hypothetical protein